MVRACSTYGERRGAYSDLVGKPEGRRRLGRPRRRWEDNSKMDFREVGWSHGHVIYNYKVSHRRRVINHIFNTRR